MEREIHPRLIVTIIEMMRSDRMNRIIIKLVFDIIKLKLKILNIKLKRFFVDVKIYYLELKTGFIFYWKNR